MFTSFYKQLEFRIPVGFIIQHNSNECSVYPKINIPGKRQSRDKHHLGENLSKLYVDMLLTCDEGIY